MKKILILAVVFIFGTGSSFAYDVIYNKKTNKFHDTDCHLTRNCVNCTVIDINKAIKIKADPCEVCRTDAENRRDENAYKKQAAIELDNKTPGVKKRGNFTYTIK